VAFPVALARKFESHAAGGRRRHVTVQAPNDVVALDPVTGRVFWIYSYAPSPLSRPCCAESIAALPLRETRCSWAPSTPIWLPSDAKERKPLWNTTVAKAESGYALDATRP